MLTADGDNDDVIFQHVFDFIVQNHVVGQAQIRVFPGVAKLDEIRRSRNVIHVDLIEAAIVSGIPAEKSSPAAASD